MQWAVNLKNITINIFGLLNDLAHLISKALFQYTKNLIKSTLSSTPLQFANDCRIW